MRDSRTSFIGATDGKGGAKATISRTIVKGFFIFDEVQSYCRRSVLHRRRLAVDLRFGVRYVHVNPRDDPAVNDTSSDPDILPRVGSGCLMLIGVFILVLSVVSLVGGGVAWLIYAILGVGFLDPVVVEVVDRAGRVHVGRYPRVALAHPDAGLGAEDLGHVSSASGP